VKRGAVYLFYRFGGRQPPPFEPAPDATFRMELWTPSLRFPWPRSSPRGKRLHFLFRTLLHELRFFPSRDSGALVVYEGDRLVHYSAFTPRYWRFPFLSAQDIQIGDTWTDPAYRGKGLAKRTLRSVVERMRKPGRSLWYVVEDVNRSSIKVAEDCGFRLAATGTHAERMKGFDYYEIRELREFAPVEPAAEVRSSEHIVRRRSAP
jgi:RimJ/RimL family protein N-acetyltransferase